MAERQPKTLAQRVRRQLLWFGSALFIASLVLIFVFFWDSINYTADAMMELEAESLIQLSDRHPDIPLPNDDNWVAALKWEGLPESIRGHFDKDALTDNKLDDVLIETADGKQQYIYLLRYVSQDERTLYLASLHQEAEINQMISRFSAKALNQAVWITLIIFTVLFFLVRWLIRRTTEPLALLSQWATELKTEPSTAMQVKFPIEELNQLAGQLREGVNEIETLNRREQQFLKHASHELRTPLATLLASLETLELTANDRQQGTINRALRAGHNMNRLSSTLLWLARDGECLPEPTAIELRLFIIDIVEEHRYLLRQDNAYVQLDISDNIITIERELLAIVVANLVRNAYQHSSQGNIMISADASGLCISNPTEHMERDSLDSITGLGLELVKRICRKLNWLFEFTQHDNTTCVSVQWVVEDENH